MKRPLLYLATPLVALAMLSGCGSGDESGIDLTGDSSVSETENSEQIEAGGLQAGGESDASRTLDEKPSKKTQGDNGSTAPSGTE